MGAPNRYKNGVINVTATNHQWASEVSGYSLEEIQKFYADSIDRGEICIVGIQFDKDAYPKVQYYSRLDRRTDKQVTVRVYTKIDVTYPELHQRKDDIREIDGSFYLI